MTRPLRVGDRVTATGTVVGYGGTSQPEVAFDGAQRVNIVDASALTLTVPAEPPVGSILVKDDIAYQRENKYGDNRWYSAVLDLYVSWEEVGDGKVIFARGGES